MWLSAVPERLGKTYVFASTLVGTALLATILGVLAWYSRAALVQVGPGLLSLEWNPARLEFGILPMLYGSGMVTLIALALSLPLGIGAGLFTSEILPSRYRLAVKTMLELLAGIPSIIYGLIGVAFLTTWLKHFFLLQSGRTILAAGILLGVMILPTLLTLSDDAFQNVPAHYREGAMGLGLYRWEIARTVILPVAARDLVGAVLLALGRALGETMAVMLVIGSIDRIPDPFFNVLAPGQTLTSKLGRETAEAAFGSLHFSALILTGLFLLLTVLGLTLAAQAAFESPARLHE